MPRARDITMADQMAWMRLLRAWWVSSAVTVVKDAAGVPGSLVGVMFTWCSRRLGMPDHTSDAASPTRAVS